MYRAFYYIAKVPKIGPRGYVAMKVGIYGVDMHPRNYIRQRYGPGSEMFYSYRFDIPMYELEENYEKPILEILKCSGDLCEIVRGQKEHFWVKEDDVPIFIAFVKKNIYSIMLNKHKKYIKKLESEPRIHVHDTDTRILAELDDYQNLISRLVNKLITISPDCHGAPGLMSILNHTRKRIDTLRLSWNNLAARN